MPTYWESCCSEIEAHSGTAPVDAHRVYIGAPRELCSRNSVCKIACPASAEKAGNLELAGLPQELMPVLDLTNQLELMEAEIEGWSESELIPPAGVFERSKTPRAASRRPDTIRQPRRR